MQVSQSNPKTEQIVEETKINQQQVPIAAKNQLIPSQHKKPLKPRKQPKKEKPQHHEPPPQLDIRQQLILNQLVRSIAERNMSNFQYHILDLKLHSTTTVGLKFVIKNFLYSLPLDFQKFIKMVMFLFEYEPCAETEEGLNTLISEFRIYSKKKYHLNQVINKTILSHFKSIPYQKLSSFLYFWGNNFVKQNQKRIEDITYCLLYSDDKDQKLAGFKIICSVAEIELPDIEFIVKLVIELIKVIKISEIDLLLYRCKEHINVMISEVKKIKTHKADELLRHIKYCLKNGYIVHKQKIKPEISPQEAIKRGLMYNYNNNPFYAFQDKFKQKEKFHLQIAFILFEYSKLNAMYFVDRYNLSEHQLISKIFLKYKDGSIHQKSKLERNILEERDDFGITEGILTPEYKDEYLSFSHFGLKQEDVVFISDVDQLFEQADLCLSKSPIIAFDIESSGGVCREDKQITQTIQIATETKVYIFDVPKLKGNKSFQNLLIKLFCQLNDQTALGFAYHGNDQKSLKWMLAGAENVKLKPVIDLQKQNHWKKKGTSLKDLVKAVFDKNLSKFEQCSGWNNRPLRKAQIHYAALDSYVLVEIYKRGKEMAEKQEVVPQMIVQEIEVKA